MLVLVDLASDPTPDAPRSLADHPPVTILLPTRNEEHHIVDCLESLLRQDYDQVAEILVIDGQSSDRTRILADRYAPKVRVIENPGLTAAAAMNRGLAEAGTEIVVRVDAHTLYAPDYVRRSVDVLMSSGADWVGGPMRPVGRTSIGRAVAAVTSSPFGIGPGRFHYENESRDVDTVYLGTFRRQIVQDVGGYDEHDLQWAAEDQELSFRLRRAGCRIRLDPSIRSAYFPRQTLAALWRQYFNYGLCKASTLKKHRKLPYLRPLVPAGMVAGTAVFAAAVVVGRRPWMVALPFVAYGLGAGVVAYRLSDEPGVAPHRVLGAIAVCHWSYGLGFWSGAWRILSGRPFDSRPGEHRCR